MSNLEQFYRFISAHAEKTSNDRILCEICNEVIKRKYIPDHNLKCDKRKRFTPSSQPIISPQTKSLFGGKPIITEIKKPVNKLETKLVKPELIPSTEPKRESIKPDLRPSTEPKRESTKPDLRSSTASESKPESSKNKQATESRLESSKNKQATETRPERATETRPESRSERTKESRSERATESRPERTKESRLVNKNTSNELKLVNKKSSNNILSKKSDDIWMKENDIINNISDDSSDEFISVLTEYNGNMEWSDTSSDELDTILTITESMGKIKNSYNRLNVPAKPIKLLPAEFKIKYSAMDRDRKHKLKKLYKFFQTCEEESKSIPKQFVKFNMPEDKKYVKKIIKTDEEELSSKIDSMLNKYASVL